VPPGWHFPLLVETLFAVYGAEVRDPRRVSIVVPFLSFFCADGPGRESLSARLANDPLFSTARLPPGPPSSGRVVLAHPFPCHFAARFPGPNFRGTSSISMLLATQPPPLPPCVFFFSSLKGGIAFWRTVLFFPRIAVLLRRLSSGAVPRFSMFSFFFFCSRRTEHGLQGEVFSFCASYFFYFPPPPFFSLSFLGLGPFSLSILFPVGEPRRCSGA